MGIGVDKLFGGTASKPRKSKARGVACIGSGYRYEFTGKSGWHRGPDDRWDTVVGRKFCGRVIGTRFIDGAMVTVLRRGDKIAAATRQSVVRRRSR